MGETVPEKTAPLVSVAMSVLNGAATLPAALASLRLQSHRNWELILVDDGSTDGSARVARSLGDARIHVVSDGARRGLPARLNQAVDLARGTYIARMDADDVSYPDRFARQVSRLQAEPALDLVCCAAVVFGGAGEPFGLMQVSEEHARICARPWAGFRMPHPTWMGRVEWFRRNRYNEANARSEDQELLLSTYAKSRFAGIASPLLGYRQDALPLGKVLRSRRSFAQALWRHAAGARAPAFGLRGISGQAAKAAVDAFAISTGLGRGLLRHRARPLSASDAANWREVWLQVTRESGARCDAMTGLN